MKKIAAYAIVALVFLHLLTSGLWKNFHVNTQFSRWDQAAVMKLSMAIQASGNPFVTDANRHPLFSALSAPFVDWSRGGFARAKIFAMVTGAACFAFLLFLKRRPGGLLSATWLSLFLAAPAGLSLLFCQYVPDLLFTGLNAAAFLMLCRSFGRPRRAAAGGFVAGLSFLVKYTALMVPAVFVLVSLFWVAGLFFRRRFQDAKSLLLAAFLTCICFLSVTAPLLLYNVRTHGHFFHNVNARYYVWFDSWEACKAFSALTRDRAPSEIHRKALSQLPDSLRPSLRNYFNTHTPGAFPYRLRAGVLLNLNLWWEGRGAVFLSLFGLGLALSIRGFQPSKLKWNPAIFFSVSYLGIYFLSASWYAAVACNLRYLYPLHAVAGLCGAWLMSKGEEKGDWKRGGMVAWVLVAGLTLALLIFSEPHLLRWPGWRAMALVNGPVYPYE